MVRLVIAIILISIPVGAADIDSRGFILHWLILGPLSRAGGPNPGVEAMREDYLTDGTVTEKTIMPFPGMIVDVDFSIAASTDLKPTPNNPDLNPTGKPEWYEYHSSTDTIDFQSAGIYGQDLDDLVTYAVCYVENKTGAPINGVTCQVASDDAIQVYLNEEEIWINDVARGVGGSGVIQDTSPPFVLPTGMSRIMVKVFEGWGGTAFRLKLVDGAGPLLSDRIGVSVIPYGPCPETVEVRVNSWLREVTFAWEHRFSRVVVRENGEIVGETTEISVSELTLEGVALGDHRYEFQTFMAENDPPCEVLEVAAQLVPVWPRDFQCTYRDGNILFSWRNPEPYYDVLKIRRNGSDVVGVEYDEESAVLASFFPPGTYTFELVAESAGYKSSGISCEVEVTGPPPEFRRGDSNADGSVDVADAVFLLGYLFSGGEPLSCPDSGDANDDGKLDISDAVAVLRYLFTGTTVPEPGAESCGPDPTADELIQCDYPADSCG